MPVNGDAVGELNAVDALVKEFVLVVLLERTRKDAKGCLLVSIHEIKRF